MPSTWAGSRSFELGEAGDIDHDPNQFTGGRKRGAAERSHGLPGLRLLGATLTIAGSHIGVGIDNEKPRVRRRAAPPCHLRDDRRLLPRSSVRRATCARMATWLLGLPRRNTNPPSRQSVARKMEGGISSAATITPAGTDLIGFTCQMPQHAITQITQIGCAGAEIGIVGRIVRCDFRIDRRAPRLDWRARRRRSAQTPARQDCRLRAARSGKKELLPRQRPRLRARARQDPAATPRAHRRGPGAPPPQIDVDGHHALREPNARAVPTRFRGRRISPRCDGQLDAFYRPS